MGKLKIVGIGLAIFTGLFLIMMAVSSFLNSPDIENPQSKVTERCSLFCDSTGYQPKWAKGMGDMQSNNKCISILTDDYGSKDSNWCMEHAGKMMDDMN